MARTRRTTGTTAVPKQPKVKLQRPKVRDLRMIYKGLITTSVSNRLATLAYVLQWYDGAVPYVIWKKKLTADGQKKLAQAVKAKNLGVSSTRDAEKETAFRTAIKLMEKATEWLKPAPIEKEYLKLKKAEGRLGKKQERLDLKFGQLQTQLQLVTGGRLKVEIAEAPNDRKFNPELNTLTLNRTAARDMAKRIRQEGLLPVWAGELETLARYAALKPDGQGRYLYDPEEHVKAMAAMAQEFVTYARMTGAPKRLVRAARTVITAAGGQKQPRVGRAGFGGKRTASQMVGGFLVKGTAIGTIYERLADEKEHTLAEVLDGIQAADPVGRVKQLNRYGQQKGTWDVRITGDKVQLTQRVQAVQP